MSWQHMLLSKKNHVGMITLNRPEKLNALGGRMRQELEEAINETGADSDVRVIVITGTGKGFCSGGDVSEYLDGTTKALAKTAPNQRPVMARIVLALNTMEKPVIAAVNGLAVGGGANLALACDIRIASQKAQFGQVFTSRGLHPDWGGSYFLPRLAGYAKACELIFSADVISAREALEAGLVNKVVPHNKLMTATMELAQKIANNAPIPMAYAKRALQNFQKWDLAQALDYESYVVGITTKSKDAIEGFTAFMEKREPKFKGE